MAIVSAIAVGGCSLFVDLDDLTSGGAITTGDAGLDAVAPTDAIATDDHANVVDAADAAAGPFCPQAGALLCEDFDEADAATGLARWDVVVNGGADPTLSSAFVTSAPRALHIATPSSGGSCAVGAKFSGTTITASFDLYMESRGGNLTVAWVDIGGDDVYFQPIDEAHSDLLEGFDPGDGGFVYSSTDDGTPIALGHFVHVDFALDFPKAMATVTLDGKPSVSRKLLGADWKTANKGVLYFGCPATGSTSLYYDDVTLR